MNYAIIFLSLIIIFLSIMLVFKIKIYFDLFNNYIVINVKVFNIQVISIDISLFGFYLKINKSKKVKTYKIFLDQNQEYLIKQMKLSIFDKLYFDSVIFSSEIGVLGSDKSVMIVSTLNALCEKIKCKLSTKLNDCDFEFDNTVNFLKDILYMEMYIKVYFTIFDFIFAIILSFYKRSKYVKERKFKTRKQY